ncbi:DUF3231 family protein [Paenibacillus alkaliterrae]
MLDIKCEVQTMRLSEFLIKEGIPLPPTSEPKPKSEHYDIPLGIKLTDDEIANVLSLKTVSTVISCASAASASIRTDVGVMFTHFLSEKLKYSSFLKTLTRKGGWIKVPPYYIPNGLPQQ